MLRVRGGGAQGARRAGQLGGSGGGSGGGGRQAGGLPQTATGGGCGSTGLMGTSERAGGAPAARGLGHNPAWGSSPLQAGWKAGHATRTGSESALGDGWARAEPERATTQDPRERGAVGGARGLLTVRRRVIAARMRDAGARERPTRPPSRRFIAGGPKAGDPAPRPRVQRQEASRSQMARRQERWAVCLLLRLGARRRATGTATARRSLHTDLITGRRVSCCRREAWRARAQGPARCRRGTRARRPTGWPR